MTAGCSKRTTPVLLDPSVGTTSITTLCPQVENFNFPNNRAFVSVVDQAGVAITDFALGNFVASENGTPCVVLNYKKVDNFADVLYTVICLDESGSMGSDLAVAQTAAINYVNAMSVNDYAEIILFSDTVRVVQTFTNDKALLTAAINSAVFGPATSFYDAIVQGMKDIDTKKGRKTVLLLTDGLDNNSKETEASSIIRANKAGIACFTIGLGSADFINLQTIATSTGGRFYQSVSSAQLTGIFANIFYLMNNLVEVQFRSRIGELKKDDNTRELTVYLNYGTTLSKSCKKTYGY